MQRDQIVLQLQTILYLLSIDPPKTTQSLVLSTMKVQKEVESQARSEVEEAQAKTQQGTPIKISLFQLQMRVWWKEVDHLIDQKAIRSQLHENESEAVISMKGS